MRSSGPHAQPERHGQGRLGDPGEGERHPRLRAGLVELGAAQLVGLPHELLERVLAAAERLEHADAVHGLLDARRQVPGLVPSAPRDHLVVLPEPEAEPDHGHGPDQVHQAQRRARRQHETRAHEHGRRGHDELHETEDHPPADGVQVPHRALQELPAAAPVVERDGQVEQVTEQVGAHGPLDAGAGGRDERAAAPHEYGLEHAEDQHEQSRLHDSRPRTVRQQRTVDDRAEHLGHRERDEAGDERRGPAEHHPWERRPGPAHEAEQRTRRGGLGWGHPPRLGRNPCVARRDCPIRCLRHPSARWSCCSPARGAARRAGRR